MTTKNAKTFPQIYYGLHMAEGVAEYAEPDKKPYRILINENAIKGMDPTFAGKPVYVHHVDQVNIENLQEEADGYVIESFFNKADGKHWAKFIVVSDKGHEAIRNGWRLSNAYIPKDFSGGGQWHGVDYDREVTRGEYEHLAIVNNPRYEESVILTPDQFKDYNFAKEQELVRLANEKQGARSMLSLFKKSKVENTSDFEGMTVKLPKSGKEKTIIQLVNDADMMEMPEHMANGDHMVEVGGSKMKVNDLVAKHTAMCNEYEEYKKMNPPKNEIPSDNPDHNKDEVKKNEEEEKKKAEAAAEEKKSNEKKAAEEKSLADKKAADAHFEALKNAPNEPIKNEVTLQLSEDKLARGKSRYGSN